MFKKEKPEIRKGTVNTVNIFLNDSRKQNNFITYNFYYRKKQPSKNKSTKETEKNHLSVTLSPFFASIGIRKIREYK